MTNKTTITHHPLILNEKVMKKRTAQALQDLWEIHPQNMFLKTAFYQTPARGGFFCDYYVGFSKKSARASITLSMALDVLKEYKGGRKALRDALFAVQTDTIIEDLPTEVLDYQTPDSNCNQYRKVTFLPGFIHVAGEGTLSFLTYLRDRPVSTPPNKMEMRDLGYFVAGKYKTAHEKLEIQSRINSYREGWISFSDTFSKAQDRNQFTFMQHRFEFGEPAWEE